MNASVSRIGSFSSKVKDELASTRIGSDCCVLSELSGLLYTAGTLEVGADESFALKVNSRSRAASERALTLASALIGEPLTDEVWIGERARRMLTMTGLLGDQGWFAVTDVERPSANPRQCCRLAFLRGTFLGGGSVADPAKEYHLEFVSDDERLGSIWMELLEGLRLNPRQTIRKNQRVVYLKEAEQLALLLTHMGAAAARLAFEDARILKDMRNQVNRATNCDAANLDKALDAADRQIRAIRIIAERRGLGSLPDPLREVAEARLNNPDLPLTELGETLRPTVGKSGVNHRLKKLEAIADSLYNENWHD